MTKTLSVLAAAAIIAIASASPADAGCRGCAFGAGLLGGFALGAIAAGAAGPPVYAAPAPVYVAPGPSCWREPRGPRYWDGYRWVQPTVQVCQ